MTSRNSLSNASAPGSFPRRTLVAISQADAAETRITFASSAMIVEALRLRNEGESVAHRSVCVSSRTLNRPLHSRVSAPLRGEVQRKRPPIRSLESQERRAASSRPGGLLQVLRLEFFRG